MNIGTLVNRAASRYGNAVALEEPGRQQSFLSTAERTNRLASALLNLGLAPGDRVLDLQKNAITYIETDFGISTAGLVRVALNYRLSRNDWMRIAQDCDARALIYAAEFADDVSDLRKFVEHTVVIGDGDGLPYDKLLSKSSDKAPQVDLSPDALVSLNYSSGTTGHPKGSRRTHRNRVASFYNILTDIVTPLPGDTWCHAGPITHASGLFVLPYFVRGARQYILPTFDVEHLVESLTEQQITGTVLVPTMITRLLMQDSIDSSQTSSLRCLLYAGSPMPSEQIRECFERITPNLVQMYGLVEAIPPVTVLSIADHFAGVTQLPELLSSAGLPCSGVELRIVDEAGSGLPTGDIGEVITRGDHIMSGYWGAQDRTAAKSVDNGWLHTGDLGKVDDSGRLYLVDRKGDMIISGGYNVYPREVEDVIAELDGVAEVAVVGLTDPEWGERIVALYSVRERQTVTPETVLEHCRTRLAAYKKPKDVRLVAEFPLQATGKISKRQLRADLDADRAPR